MAEIAVLKTHIINYAKTRDIYAAYRKAGYSRKYYDAHESDILIHKAAKKAFDDLALKKLPTVKSLQAEYSDLLVQKKLDYAELSKARDEAKRLHIIFCAGQNISGGTVGIHLPAKLSRVVCYGNRPDGSVAFGCTDHNSRP